jgi:hypothetical protein
MLTKRLHRCRLNRERIRFVQQCDNADSHGEWSFGQGTRSSRAGRYDTFICLPVLALAWAKAHDEDKVSKSIQGDMKAVHAFDTFGVL